MPPVRAYRIDYADGSSWHSHQGRPPVKGVLAVMWWHDPPYRTIEYGHETYEVDGVTLPGKALSDDEWEAYRLSLHVEPHALEEAK